MKKMSKTPVGSVKERRRSTLEPRAFKDQMPPASMAELHRRAEARLRAQPNVSWSPCRGPKTAIDSRRLLHELQVHQVELEMQNAELQKTRDELEVALENYTDLYDFAPAGYFTLAAEGAIRQVNLTGAQLVGAERSRLVGQSFGLLLTTEFRPAFNAFLEQVFAGENNQSTDVQLLRRGQPPQFVRIGAKRSSTGRDCRAVVLDITELKREEDRVRVSEVRFRRLFEAANDGVLILDPDSCKITEANPFMTSLLSCPNDQLVGKGLFEIGLLPDNVANRKMFQMLKRQPEIRYENVPLENRDGRHQEVEVVANLYREDGKAVIQCSIRDITMRKRTEDILRRNEALFAALIEQAPVGVYVVDDRLCLLQVNPKARPVFKNIHPLIGRDFSEIIQVIWSPLVANQIVARFRHTLRTGESFQSPEFAERRQDIGRQEVYEWQLHRVTLPAGELGVVCFFSNITGRKQAEAAQRRVEVLAASNRKLEQEIVRRKTLEETLKETEQRLRHLSHELLHAQEEERKHISRELHDTVLQTLVGINIHLAALTPKPTDNPGSLQQKIAQTQLLVEKSMVLVHRFALELRPMVLDDLGLIPALHSYLKDFLKRTGLRARLTAYSKVEQMPIATRAVLYRVALEALNNVARHAQATQVEVKIKEVPHGICLTIMDDGKSFDVEHVLLMKGNGRLGLLGMRERLEMVGGKFSVASQPGQGTTVTAQIPLLKEPAEKAGKST